MEVAGLQQVLRCGLCRKPFDKQSTMKRHGYYCRSRNKASGTRLRSCVPCARAKAGCDKKLPRCSRCATKAIECQYPKKAHPHRASTLRTRQNYAAPIELSDVVPSSVAGSLSVDSHREASNDDNSAGTLLNLGFEGLERENFGWYDDDFGTTDFPNWQANDFYLPPRPSASVHHEPAVQAPQDGFSPHSSIPRALNTTVRSLIQRPMMQAGAHRLTNLISHTLKSYPLMMLLHNTLPPFIHPSLVSANIEDVQIEPLHNCVSLMHMISSGIQGSRKLFWRNVRMECERWAEEHLSLSKWELVAAMQALSIYVLLRLYEGETDYNNFDSLLVKTVTVIAIELGRIDAACNKECALCNSGLENSWKEWAFRESRRRLAVVYRVVNMLIYFEPAAMCDMPTDFILAPLPAKKRLWEANDKFEWKAERQKEPQAHSTFGLASNGEVVRLDESRISCSDAWRADQSPDVNELSKNTTRWEEWCTEIDSFGGLVMLAASFMA